MKRSRKDAKAQKQLDKLLFLNVGILTISGVFLPVTAQTIPPNQLPIPVQPTIPPQTPETLPPLQQILPTPPNIPTAPEQNLENLAKTITVQRFEFDGSTIFSQNKLRETLAEFTGKPLTFTQLLQAAAKITNLYIQAGYETSGAYIPEQDPTDGIVKIQIVEGSIPEIRVSRQENSSRSLQDNYVRSRLQLATAKPVNIRRLEEAIQLLQLNPLISSISAELSAGTTPGTNILTVKIAEANTDSLRLIADNSRNPSVGSFRRGVEIERANLTGLGDQLNIAYDNTNGSNAIDANYTIPINPRDGTISFSYSNTQSKIIESPFDELDVQSNSRNYELTLRQPLVKNASQQFTQEFALGLTLSRRESNTSVLGVDFPISVGADAQGNTRISALRFFQEWTRQSFQEVLVARSQFSLGVGAFDATINNEAPDSRFFAWRGQFLWLRLLGSANSNPRLTPRLLLRSDFQLANRTLVPLEQFTLGGIFSVRGYRQDAVFSDNGAFVSVDLQLPVYSTNNGENILQVIPFIDVGTAWNSSSREAPDPNTLAAVGLGLQWQMGEKLKARFDYGVPLIDIDSRDRTWQENGLYFSIQYNLF